jgi:hypothetical protein
MKAFSLNNRLNRATADLREIMKRVLTARFREVAA